MVSFASGCLLPVVLALRDIRGEERRGEVCIIDLLGSKKDLWLEAPLVFASAREFMSGCGPKENEELKERRGREPDGDGARGTAKPAGGVAAIARCV